MTDSFQVLRGKYQMAIVSIRELEQERDEISQQAESLRKSNDRLNKNVKYLCETILKKDREQKGEQAWFRLPIDEMVAAAQKSVENYFPSMEKTYHRLLKVNYERTDKIAELENEIDNLKEAHKRELKEQADYKDTIINKLKEKLRTGKLEDDEIENITSSVKETKESIDMDGMDDSGNVAIFPENEDGIGDAVGDAVSAMHEAGAVAVAVTPYAGVYPPAETKQAVKREAEKVQARQANKARENARKLTDTQKLTIRCLGETGYSVLPVLIADAQKKFPDIPVKSRLTNGLRGISEGGNEKFPEPLVERYDCPVPGAPNFAIYQLTQAGRDVYAYLFQKEAVESEMSQIKKNHTSYEHGYGIKRIAEMIQSSIYVKKMNAEVIYMTRTKDYMIKTGIRTSYIPDIILVYKNNNGRETREYYEYETCKCNETDLFSKCNKIAAVSRFINIIVSGTKEKEIMLKRFEDWKESLMQQKEWPFSYDKPIECRVITYKELLVQSNVGHTRNIEWTRIPISRPKKSGKGGRQ